MSGGPEVRQQLAEALPHLPWCNRNAAWDDGDDLACIQHRWEDAGALLPVVERIAAERAAEALREAADEFAAGGSACGDYWAPGTEERREAEEISRQISGEYRPHWPEAYSPYCDGCAAAEAADTDRDHVVSTLRARAEAMVSGRQEGP